MVDKLQGASASIIGGADGPTAVFIAGKFNPATIVVPIVVAVVVIAAVVLIVKKRKR
ncbi:MAG: sodium ion-translocating decarboxylase subunit beta [Lachnospiraceae bacterium]|nr:sodium ion-translocating decarboxylase subunit beta [Lachnospiraceae bacterium]